MAKKQESLFCSDLESKLREDIDLGDSSILLKGLEIRHHEKILYDITNLYGGLGFFKPQFGFLEQDIVIGKNLKVPDDHPALFFLIGGEAQIETSPRNVLTIQSLPRSELFGFSILRNCNISFEKCYLLPIHLQLLTPN